ncbi:MAG TPA: tRNA lysidine(34) synthetase TilS, partial [Saprospiraceae bacterium]|nr:tRNA lysidine(34) synthetase TilS [Saprospiraceae bacterium]
RSIECYRRSFVIKPKSNIQLEARRLRYEYFEEIKREKGFKYILTAHHADDAVETFFLNLARGAGIKGLRSLQYRSEDRIKPLLGFSKEELRSFAKSYQVPFREDESNRQPDYLRNFFRLEVLPIIRKRLPAFEKMAFRSLKHLADAESCLKHLFEEWKQSRVTTTGSGFRITRPLAHELYLLKRFLAEMGFHPEIIQTACERLDEYGLEFTGSSDYRLRLDHDSLFLVRKTEVQSFTSFDIDLPSGICQLDQGTLIWDCIGEKVLPEIKHDDPFVAWFARDQILPPLRFRTWNPGDRMKPFGMSGKSRKVQDILTDHKISRWSKKSRYVLEAGGEIIWIPGMIRFDGARLQADCKEVIRFQWFEDVEAI